MLGKSVKARKQLSKKCSEAVKCNNSSHPFFHYIINTNSRLFCFMQPFLLRRCCVISFNMGEMAKSVAVYLFNTTIGHCLKTNPEKYKFQLCQISWVFQLFDEFGHWKK